MVCYSPSGYMIFSLRKLKSYEGWGLEARGWGPDIRAGGWGPDNPNNLEILVYDNDSQNRDYSKYFFRTS